MLDTLVGVEQQRAADADFGSRERRAQRVEPVRHDRYDVVVEEQEKIAGAARRAAVALLRKIVGALVAQQRHAGLLGVMGVHLGGEPVGVRVGDDDDLGHARCGEGEQPIEQLRQQAAAVLGADDDRDARAFGVLWHTVARTELGGAGEVAARARQRLG